MVFILITIQCNSEEEQEQPLSNVDKSGSVETVISSKNVKDAVILTTKHSIWKDNKKVKDVIYNDTIPQLGDTMIEVESNSGGTKIKQKKDYKHFITVSGQ